MAFSTQSAVSDGTLSSLNVSIQYIKQADISVFYDDVPAGVGTYAWAGDTPVINFTPTIPNGVEVRLTRSTQINQVINRFAAGAAFTNTSMDTDFKQMLLLAQEYSEGSGVTDAFADVDFHGFRPINIGEAVNPGDAVSLGQYQADALGAQVARDEAEAAAASASADAAVVAESLALKANLLSPVFTAQGGTDGGQINFALPPSGSTLVGGVSIDLAGNSVRIFESQGTNRGVVLNMLEAAAGVASKLYHEGFKPTAAVLSWIQAGAGAISRFIQDKLRESVSVKDFGAAGDYDTAMGTGTDDAPAFLLACQALGSKGGIVRYYDKHLIDSSLTVPPNVTLRGPWSLVGTPGNNGSTAYGNMAALVVNPAATINFNSGSGHDGGLVYRKGMVFPAPNTTGWSGDAFTAAGDDTFLVHSQVMGFNRAFYANNRQRPRVHKNWLDNLNGIEIAACFDIAYVSDNHAWPFATIATYAGGGGVDKTLLHRPGSAFHFRDGGDWNKATNNFSYGYMRGHKIVNCNSMTVLGGSADNTTVNTGAAGIEVSGTSNGTRLLAWQGAAQDTAAIIINTSDNLHTHITAADTWVNTQNGILINGGDVTILNGNNRNTVNGININNANSRVHVDGVRFYDVTSPIQNTSANTTLRVKVGRLNNWGNLAASVFPVGGTLTTHTIASAGAIDIPAAAEDVIITGTTNFGALGKGYASRTVTLYFTGVLTVLNATSSSASMRLSGGANFTTSNGATLTLKHNGVQWYETGRSA